jgi:hypothetical protein
MRMTIEQVRARIAIIDASSDDAEAAHALEERLWRDVLRYLAGSGNELAAEALKTRRIEFARWRTVGEAMGGA